MDYIVKETSVPIFEISAEEKQFQLFAVDTVKDINEVDVQIPRDIGIYTLSNLTNVKNRLLERIQEIDAKIAAINALETIK
jgi:hypothetical protein